MPYRAELSRANPSCFLFLIDQSNSMAKPFGAQAEQPKAQGVADGINRLLQNLALKCAKPGGVRDYFHVACRTAERISRPLSGRDEVVRPA
jgi:hypothetical protein